MSGYFPDAQHRVFLQRRRVNNNNDINDNHDNYFFITEGAI